MDTNIKPGKIEIVSNVTWKFAEQIAAQIVAFIISIVLARLLSPEDYGQIAMVTIFITLANVFTSGGFGNALIQKKNAEDIDFSSVLWFGFIFAIVLYVILFFLAPLIANFYNYEILSPVLRVLGLGIIISSLCSVQQVYIAKKMIFKKLFFSTFGATVLSGILGIIMAYKGFGVWALVASTLCNQIAGTIILWLTVKWKPRLVFSFVSIKGLFSFGYKLFITEILNVISNNIRRLVIGKLYSSSDLGFYDKGVNFPTYLMASVNVSINSVLFPAMSQIQDDKERLKELTRRYVRIASYILFPLLVGFTVVSKPVVIILLTEKWVECVPFIAIGCFTHAVTIIQYGVQNYLKATGRSDVFLWMDIAGKVVSLTLLLLFINQGVMAIALTSVVSGVINVIIKVVVSKHVFGYKYKEHFMDNIPIVLAVTVMGILVYVVQFLELSSNITLLIQVPLGIIVYILFSVIFKLEGYYFVLFYINKIWQKIRPKRKNA